MDVLVISANIDFLGAKVSSVTFGVVRVLLSSAKFPLSNMNAGLKRPTSIPPAAAMDADMLATLADKISSFFIVSSAQENIFATTVIAE
jgi:hypothetical protein